MLYKTKFSIGLGCTGNVQIKFLSLGAMVHVVEGKHAAGMKGPLFHFVSKILLIHSKFTVKLSCKSVLPAVSGSFIFF